jgi:putative ABC transport system permease protein
MLAGLRERYARFRAFFKTRELDREFDEELQSHLTMLTDDNIARGMTPEAARRAASLRVGPLTPLKEQHRETRGLHIIDTLLQDLRLAVRLLVKQRAFTAAVVSALSLGIGVNTAVFTIVNGWNLQELPVDEPERIMHVGTLDAQGRARGVSYLDFLDWQKASRTFSGLAAYAGASFNIAIEGLPADHLGGTFISANAFSLLREHPILGREFRPEDDRVGAEPVAIIGHTVWINQFAADRSVVGRTIRVNGLPTTVIGVMPAGFMFPVLSDMWLPLAQTPGLAAQPRERPGLDVFGRLAGGATLAQSRTELSTIAAALAQQFPAPDRGVRALVEKFTDHFFGPPPLIIPVAVGFVLLIACANAASLLLARAVHRVQEMALRSALGASRRRLLRQLLVESLLLSALAGAFALVIAWPIVRAIAAETADFGLPYWARLTFDGRVFGFVAAVSIATAMLFGLVPAWKLSGARTGELLKDGGRTMTGGLRSRRWISGLLVAELALSVVLLASAALLIRSALLLYRADQVIDASKLLTARVSLPPAQYRTPQQRLMFYDQLEERLASISSIESAAIGTALPFAGGTTRNVVLERDDVEASTNGQRRALTLAIGSTYLETIGVPLLRGRSFDSRDGGPGQQTAIVNERFAEAYLPGEDAIGWRIRLVDPAATHPSPVWLTVVGVARTVRHSLGPARPVVYLPLRSQPAETVALIVRGSGNSAALAPLLREHVRRLDPDLPVYRISTLNRLSEQSRWLPRAVSSLLTLFAAIATVLSTMGLYAVTTYSILQRTSEIGVRMALGAQRRQVLWLFLKGTLGHVGLGLAIGIIGAIAVAQLLRGTLTEANALDPLTFAGVAVLMGTVALLACLVPTWRASALDPATALRHD